jgi:hypothetical protein
MRAHDWRAAQDEDRSLDARVSPDHSQTELPPQPVEAHRFEQQSESLVQGPDRAVHSPQKQPRCFLHAVISTNDSQAVSVPAHAAVNVQPDCCSQVTPWMSAQAVAVPPHEKG